MSNAPDLTIDLDEFVFEIINIDARRGYAAKTWALPEDCYEACDDELTFDVDYVIAFNDDGDAGVVYFGAEAAAIADEHVELIEEKVWEALGE